MQINKLSTPVTLVIELVLGLLSGLCLGITGIAPTSLILIVLDALHIGNFKKTIGAILFVNLFPLTTGSVWEFYKAGQIDFTMGYVLTASIMIGAYFGAKMVVRGGGDGGSRWNLTEKTIKYITAIMGFFIGAVFWWSAANMV